MFFFAPPQLGGRSLVCSSVFFARGPRLPTHKSRLSPGRENRNESHFIRLLRLQFPGKLGDQTIFHSPAPFTLRVFIRSYVCGIAVLGVAWGASWFHDFKTWETLSAFRKASAGASAGATSIAPTNAKFVLRGSEAGLSPLGSLLIQTPPIPP